MPLRQEKETVGQDALACCLKTLTLLQEDQIHLFEVKIGCDQPLAIIK